MYRVVSPFYRGGSEAQRDRVREVSTDFRWPVGGTYNLIVPVFSTYITPYVPSGIPSRCRWDCKCSALLQIRPQSFKLDIHKMRHTQIHNHFLKFVLSDLPSITQELAQTGNYIFKGRICCLNHETFLSIPTILCQPQYRFSNFCNKCSEDLTDRSLFQARFIPKAAFSYGLNGAKILCVDVNIDWIIMKMHSFWLFLDFECLFLT